MTVHCRTVCRTEKCSFFSGVSTTRHTKKRSSIAPPGTRVYNEDSTKKERLKTMKNQEFELTTFDLDTTPESEFPDIAVHNPVTGNYMWLCTRNNWVEFDRLWSPDQMFEYKMSDDELLRAEIWFKSQCSHLIDDEYPLTIDYERLCIDMGLVEGLNDLDLDQWCDSRGTDQAIAKAIFERCTVPSEAQEIWHSPYSLEEKIVSRAFELTDEDQLHWGQETYKR